MSDEEVDYRRRDKFYNERGKAKEAGEFWWTPVK